MRRTAIVLLAALTAGCGTSAGGATGPSSPAGRTTASLSAGPSVPPVAGIEAEAVRLRTDEAIGGQVQVRVTNTGEQPFTVTSVAIDSPGFTALPVKAETATYAPRQVIDLPTPFGDPVCDVAAEPAAALLTVVRPDGATEELRVPLSAEILTRIHDEECAARRVLEVVDIAVDGWRDEPDGVTATLTLTRRSGAAPVAIGRLARSVLVEPSVDLPLTLEDGAQSASAEIVFAPASCDPHVLAETKQPYLFVLGVTVGEEDEVPVDLPLDGGDKDALAAMVDRVCG
ncbi:hypothetical protein [Geodermatophilus sp. URMC 64]